jgi:hypothetical protein
MFSSDPTNGNQRLSSISGDAERMCASIAFVRQSLHEAALLKFINKANQPTWEHPETFRHVLLTGAFGGGDHPQRPHMRRRQAQGPKAFSEPRSRVCPQLSEQEGW